MKTAKILQTTRRTSPSHCALRYVEVEELIGEFGTRTRLGKLAAALRVRLEEEGWDCNDLSAARAEYEKQRYVPDSEFMAELARKATSARSHERSKRAGAPSHRTTTPRS